jgi:DinB superfamily
MKLIIETLQKIITEYLPPLRLVSEKDFSSKPSPHKWSKKEILGHLVDSAQTNIRRFVITQYEELPLIIYRQDNWVSICNYQNYPTKDLIELWTFLNRHICIILANTGPDDAQRKCASNNSELYSIAWLAEDYNKHLLHHLHQILNLTAIAYP